MTLYWIEVTDTSFQLKTLLQLLNTYVKSDSSAEDLVMISNFMVTYNWKAYRNKWQQSDVENIVNSNEILYSAALSADDAENLWQMVAAYLVFTECFFFWNVFLF